MAASAAKPVEAPVEAGPQYVTIVEGPISRSPLRRMARPWRSTCSG
uniref:Uncharacterized protein n=1 Tax=Phenylobacterium glaciei TaxID=2803784 RepID=A0A974S8P4_9CAUL|nr:hypothetical protein JKL49_15150 [Phenylobacterium glaciei]